jgi:predicted SAM-dependent methyltransferase
MAMRKTFLHVGCGIQTKENTTKGFNTDEWMEVRLDIDPSVNPDIVASITEMSSIPDGSYDAIFSSHNIEHLHPFDVMIALGEFKRVLKDDGFLILTCPDLQGACELIANDQLLEPIYQSEAGPISPIDILYGYRPMTKNNEHMQHLCGFTESVLKMVLQAAGFAAGMTQRRPIPFIDLYALATKTTLDETNLNILRLEHFPK